MPKEARVNPTDIINALVYGLVEGITEWLPISSTGHMLLLDQFVRLGVSQDFWNMFLVVIQLGAILAVCVLFFRDLNPLAPSKSPDERRFTWSLWGKIIVACLPAAIIGIPLDDWMEEHLGSPYVIAVALIVYGVLFIVIENAREHRAEALALEIPKAQDTMEAGSATFASASHPGPRHMAPAPGAARDGGGDRGASPTDEAPTAAALADRDAPVRSIRDLGWARAIGIGLFQVLSMVPGTSRSGSTIIGGLLLGCSRAVAAEFTFYLAVPVMVGASGLRIFKYFHAGNVLAQNETVILLVGCAVAFLVSLLAIRFLMAFVKRHDFKPFGWYRIALGLAVIAYFALLR